MNNNDITWAQLKEAQRQAEIARAKALVEEEEEGVLTKAALSVMLFSALAMPWLVLYFIQITGGMK